MLNLINLGDMYYEKKCNISGFLFGPLSIEEMRERKIVILGTGLNSFLCTCLLEKNGLSVDTYCENFAPLVGSELASKKIASSYETFRNEKDDYYFISTVDRQYINDVCAQFFVYGIKNYALFYAYNFDKSDNKKLNSLLLKCINIFINNYYGYPSAIENEVINRNRRSTNPVTSEQLLFSTRWYKPIYEWLYNEFSSGKDVFNVLEIGPGRGFLSFVLKHINPDFLLDWIEFRLEESVEETYIDKIDKKYKATIYYGIIEDPHFKIPDKYDIIIMTEVFEHFCCHPLGTTKKIANALKDNGKLYLSTPNWGHLYTYETWRDMRPFGDGYGEYHFTHNYQYSKDELLEIFEEAGLTVKDYAVSSNNHHNFVLKRLAHKQKEQI